MSDVINQSLAYGFDKALSSTLLADFRFGFFRYKVAVLPFDYGTTPAADRGIVGLNLDKTFTSGLPAGSSSGRPGIQHRVGAGREPVQLPARSERKAAAAGRQHHRNCAATTA